MLCELHRYDCPRKKQLPCVQRCYLTASHLTPTTYSVCRAAVAHPDASFCSYCWLRMGSEGWKWHKTIKHSHSLRICAERNNLCLHVEVSDLANRRNTLKHQENRFWNCLLNYPALRFLGSKSNLRENLMQAVCKDKRVTLTHLQMGFGREK